MKVEILEDEVRLVPETDFEKDALKRIHSKGIQTIKFENDWEGTGKLRFIHESETDHWRR